MKKIISLLSFVFALQPVTGQKAYKDSMANYIANYIKTHEVVTGYDKKFFRFYPVDEKYAVKARFEKSDNSKWFDMETSGGAKSINRIYGTIYFTIHDTAVKLNIYQSKDLLNLSQYKDYLFLPFTDLTCGEETYTNGRYIDLTAKDITGNTVTIDFNKAYNPYCAYVSGRYHCPIPPKENALPVAIRAGEKVFAKDH
jgi:uncharacterized protein (DUF1684 family)